MTVRAEFDGLDAVLAVVEDLAAAFVAEGLCLYLVGGVVRDLALGAHAAVDDIDLTTDAEPSVIKELVRDRATALWTQGERFGTIGATVNGRDIEITTHRAEAYDHHTRNPTVVFGTSVVDDLTRRDFTINSMAVSLPDLALVDPFDGLGDLRQRRLATPLSPEESFSDDPLRMLRAARFVPRFDLTVDEEVERAATALAGRLEIVSVERIQGELERLLAVARPAAGLEFALRTGLLEHVVVPHPSAGPESRTEPDHGAKAELERAVAVASTARTVDARRAGLLVPLGSEHRAAEALERLRYSKAITRRTLGLVRSLAVALRPDPTPPAVRRVVADIGTGALADLEALVEAVRRVDGRPRVTDDAPFVVLARDLARTEDLDDLASPMSGGEIIRHLGVAPGPDIGRAVAHLQLQRIEHGPMSDTAARTALDAWWAANRRQFDHD